MSSVSSTVQNIRHTTIFKQSLRYVLVGVSSVAIELGLFFVLHEILRIEVIPSNITAITCGSIYNFIMSRSWTFKSSSSLIRSVVLYLLLFIWNQTFSSWAIIGLMDKGLNVIVAKILTMIAITCWNFVLYRKVVFR